MPGNRGNAAAEHSGPSPTGGGPSSCPDPGGPACPEHHRASRAPPATPGPRRPAGAFSCSGQGEQPHGSHAYYEPLRAVPPVVETQRRFALALWLREQSRGPTTPSSPPHAGPPPTPPARRAAAPRRSPGLAARRATARPSAGDAVRPPWDQRHARRAAAVVTSQRGQDALKRVARLRRSSPGGSAAGLRPVGRRPAAVWPAREPGRRRPLRRPVGVGGKIAGSPAPVVHRVARLPDPNTPPIRMSPGSLGAT